MEDCKSKIRMGISKDAKAVAEAFFITSSEILINLFGKDYKKIVFEASKEEDNFFSWSNAIIYEVDKKIVGVYIAFPSKDEKRYKDNIAKMISKHCGITRLLFFLISIKKYEKRFKKPNDSFYIQILAIDKDYRGKGIAGKLYEYAEKIAKEKGYLSLICEVKKSNISSVRALEKSNFYVYKKISYKDRKTKKLEILFLMKKDF